MIVGIGVDLVEVVRMEAITEKPGRADRFAQRILAASELTDYQTLQPQWQARFLAKRFAVKEAVAKALGSGFRGGLRFQHVGVTHDELGKPMLFFNDIAAERLVRLGVNSHHVSLSDEMHYVVAMVVLEKGA